ncbi:MAG: SagB/ThcOx family dehydrogenase [Leptolyngbyaceae cyanobacterium bins.59]|nr:SagB/ThcOx family dehydrogenase [Leptolyngbyaceae cyanobacterium bins.59]
MSDLPPSITQHYHERTKYDPDTLARKSQGLDWKTQPLPYKTYKLGKEYDLKPYLEGQLKEIDRSSESSQENWQRLSQLLYYSYGLTAVVSGVTTATGDPLYLRAAPSAGGLYPAEVYLLSRGLSWLPAGLYSYQVRSHSLLQFWDENVWPDVQAACFWHPSLESTQLAIVVTAVFFRSAWRYQDRAYRRIFLDTGHLLGNVELAASLQDYRPHLIGGFRDAAMNQVLYLNPDEEGTLVVLPLADLREVTQNLPLGRTALPSGVCTNYPLLPDGQLLALCHQATQIEDSPLTGAKLIAPLDESVPLTESTDKYNFPFCLRVSTQSQPILWGDHLEDLEKSILRRRSTRAYNGAPLTLEELAALLDFTYQPHHYQDQGFDEAPDYFDLSLIETFVAVSDVKGLDEGCYYYAPKAQELRQIRFKNFRRELHYLCLGQELGRDAAAIVFHAADLSTAIAQYGDRAYRYLHLDAGHLGQRLNLAATQLKLGVSGIAGFFDNQVNEVLGIPTDEAVLYITTLGRAREG